MIRAIVRHGFVWSCLATFTLAAFADPLWALGALAFTIVIGSVGLWDEATHEPPRMGPDIIERIAAQDRHPTPVVSPSTTV